MEQIWADIKAFFTNAGLNILIGIVIIIVGLIVCRIIKAILTRVLKRAKRDEAVTHFIVSLTDVVLKIIIMISALATMGINTASIITVLGTCGVAVGLALKDSLGNLASGMLIIVNKPFKTGDFIDAAGTSGTVSTINLFNTVLLTTDNKEVVVPNGLLSSGNIINYSAMDTRRVDLEFSISYSTDFRRAREIVLDLCALHEMVLDNPEPFCRVSKHADSAIILTTRVWVKTEDYWTVFYDLTEQVKTEFDTQGIAIPFPQLDVHIDSVAEESAA